MDLVEQVLMGMGLTVEEVMKAKCYLTPEGMKKLNPCSWANEWMCDRGTVKITMAVIKQWWDRKPEIWLTSPSSSGLGPVGGWPWRRLCYQPLTKRETLLVLKAYIIKKGRPGCGHREACRDQRECSLRVKRKQPPNHMASNSSG